MGSDRPRRRAITLGAAAAVAVFGLLVASAPARAATPWWSPVALRGVAIARVSAIGDTILVRTGAGATLRSTDRGRTFATAPPDLTFPPPGVVTVGTQAWGIDPSGKVVHAANVAQSTAAVADPGSPDLGAGADLIASPAALPGVVVAVSTNGTVWRRGQDGDWKQALLLLPASLVQGVPQDHLGHRVHSNIAATQRCPLPGHRRLRGPHQHRRWRRLDPRGSRSPRLRVRAFRRLRAQDGVRGHL